MRLEHTHRKKKRLEGRFNWQADLLKEKDIDIANLKVQLSLKEAEAAEAVRRRGQVAIAEAAEVARARELEVLKERNAVLEEQVAAIESATASKDVKLASLTAQTAKLTKYLSELGLSYDELSFKASSLKAERDGLVGQILSHEVKLVVMKCLQSPGYLAALRGVTGHVVDKGMQDRLAADFPLHAQRRAHREASMVDIMDLLRLEGPATKTLEASRLQPSFEQLMLLIHWLEDQVVIRETSLSFSLDVAHSRVQILKREAASKRLSISDDLVWLSRYLLRT
uniref:Uncharacterized protein n=1 Tax=Tanacetum cinerariifolium TaxID=118510 RepID=A0A6L2LE02_TANCI|nr:hypothetical protein [Tanacetum cinerariifolium]